MISKFVVVLLINGKILYNSSSVRAFVGPAYGSVGLAFESPIPPTVIKAPFFPSSSPPAEELILCPLTEIKERWSPPEA